MKLDVIDKDPQSKSEVVQWVTNYPVSKQNKQRMIYMTWSLSSTDYEIYLVKDFSHALLFKMLNFLF